MSTKSGSSPRFRFIAAAILLIALALLFPALRGGSRRLYLTAAVVTGAILLAMLIPARLFSLDRPILSLSLYLCAAGVLALAPSDPDAALLHALRCGAATVALICGAITVRIITSSLLTGLASAFVGLLLLAGPLLSPDLGFSLAEAAQVLLLVSFASLLSSRSGPAVLLPAAGGTVLLLLQGQPVGALLLAVSFLLLLWASDSRTVTLLPALVILPALFVGSCYLKLFPWQSGQSQAGASLARLISAGLFGLDGAAAETASSLPSSSLLYPLADHYGLVFTGLSLLLFLPLLLRGASVAATARIRFHAVLAMGCTLLYGLRVLAALLSAFGVLPLPLDPVPLLTTSLPDLCGQMLAFGLLCGISSRNEADLAEDAHLAMLAR